MNTHNLCFHGEIRKRLCGYPFLSETVIIHTSSCYNFQGIYVSLWRIFTVSTDGKNI